MSDADQTLLEAWDSLPGVPDPLENPVLVGHDEILHRLASLYASGRMHHGWLISGPRGIGKATLAAHFAGHVFRNPDPASAPHEFVRPEQSDAMQSRIARGAHPNLLHLRRTWNAQTKKWRTVLPVDEIRRVNHFFATSAAEAGWRIVIIDAADDLNTNAANALLKALEEPPSPTLFFILAHSPRGLLATIRSRCQKLSMQPLGNEQLLEALAAVGLADDLKPGDRDLLTALAGGSVRRAITLLADDGLPLYREFERLLSGISAPDWTAIHKLAGELAPVRAEGRYRLLLEMAHDRVAGDLRRNGLSLASGQSKSGQDLSVLARNAEVWEKTRRSAALADSYNLDRKQVILNLFQAFHEAA